jgi:Leucine Rich repeat
MYSLAPTLVLLSLPAAAPPIRADAQTERLAAGVVAKARGRVVRDTSRSDRPVVAVLFGPESRVTDREATALKDFPFLRRLDLTFASITDVGAAHLRRLGRMRQLSLADTRITDRGMANLTGWTQSRRPCRG